MSFIKLTENIKYLKINEALIVNVIMHNTKEIINNSITLSQISREANISHSSVTRLIQKLGWSNWNEFVQSCILEETFNQKINSQLLQVLELQKIHLENYLQKNPKIIKDSVHSITKEKTIVFFGERMSGNIAQYLAFIFGRKNLMVSHFFIENDLYPFLRNQTLLIILMTDQRTDYNQLIKKANNQGTKVIIFDASSNLQKKYQNSKHYRLPLVSYFDNPDYMYLMKGETLRQIGWKIFEKIT